MQKETKNDGLFLYSTLKKNTRGKKKNCKREIETGFLGMANQKTGLGLIVFMTLNK